MGNWMFITGAAKKSTRLLSGETLIKSIIPGESGLSGNYSLKYYCFLKINPTFANRN
jgi:hypothetical protein